MFFKYNTFTSDESLSLRFQDIVLKMYTNSKTVSSVPNAQSGAL